MCFQCNGAPRDRPAFPTRRSSDLSVAAGTRDQLMAYADNLREKLGQSEAVVLLASEIDEKAARSEEHTSELQSRPHLVCRPLLEKKKSSTCRSSSSSAPPSSSAAR